MSSVIATIYNQAAAHLATLDFFITYADKVKILVQDTGEIQNEIDQALDRLGVSVLFLMRGGTVNKPNLPGPYLEDIRLTVEVSENATVNRQGTYVDGLEVVEHVMNGLHHLQVTDVPKVNEIINAAGFFLQPPAPGATLTYHCDFNTNGGLSLVP